MFEKRANDFLFLFFACDAMDSSSPSTKYINSIPASVKYTDAVENIDFVEGTDAVENTDSVEDTDVVENIDCWQH